MNLIKNGDKYYLAKSENNYYGIQGEDYTIVNGKLIWANPNIYLHFDGNSWIDTKFKPNQDTKVEIIYSPEQSSKQYECLFGSRNSSSPYNNFQVFISPFNYSYSTGRFDYGNGTSNFSYTTEIEKKYKVVADKNQLYINDTLVSTRTYNEFQGNYNIVIGGSNVGGTVEGTRSIKKYYSSKLYDNNKLIRNYVPVPKDLFIGDFVVPSNGMFDIIEQKFYPNQGTGIFTYGKDN